MYQEERRGNWFSSRSTSMIYTSRTYQEIKDDIEAEFFIINEQDGYLIQVQDVKQIELLKHCMFGCTITDQERDWLKNESKLTYFDCVDTFIACQKFIE